MADKEKVSGTSKLIKATFLVAFATALSRVLGYVREVVVAAYYGASYEIDAYRVAIQLPNLFRLILGDVVIAAAFLPIFSSYLAKNNEEESWKIASKILTLTVVFLSVVTVLGIVFSRPLISVLAPGFHSKPHVFNLSIELTKIMFPALVFMALSGLFSGILNSYEIFLLPAASPVLWNAIIIAGIILFSKSYGIYAFATSLLIASILQAFIQVPGFKDKLKYFRFDLDLSHPEVRNFFSLLIPVVLSSATSNINTVVDTRFASYLATGVIAAMGYAIRIYLVPAGIFGVAVATVLFPRLARYESLKNEEAFAKNLSFGLRVLTFIMVPLSAYFTFFSLPIVRLLFERGSFTYNDSLLTSAALFMYSIGVTAYSLSYLLSRAYYSKKDSKTPLLIALISIAVNYFGDWYLMNAMPELPELIPFLKKYKWLFAPHAGIALSTSIVAIFQFFALYFVYRKKHGHIEGKKFLVTNLKSLVATAGALLAGWGVYNLISGPGAMSILLALLLVAVAGFIVYVLTAYLLKMEEISFAADIIKEKLFRRVA